jgi:hypothetical protein
MAISDDDEATVVELLGRDVVATIGLQYLDVVTVAARAGREFHSDPDAYITWVVEDVQQYVHDVFIDTTWPACPTHPNHPMWFDQGWWRADGRPVARLGDLATLKRRHLPERL